MQLPFVLMLVLALCNKIVLKTDAIIFRDDDVVHPPTIPDRVNDPRLSRSLIFPERLHVKEKRENTPSNYALGTSVEPGFRENNRRPSNLLVGTATHSAQSYAVNDPLVTRSQSINSGIELIGNVDGLVQRVNSLEQRIVDLENAAREWRNLNRITTEATTNKVEVTDRRCPSPFFALPNSTPSSPCYYLSSVTNQRHDWKEAATDCQKLGAKLAEPQTSEEMSLLIHYITSLRDYLGGNYWTGGINPGLLWIWSGAARPLSSIKQDLWLTSSESVPSLEENGKCLRLAFDRASQRYGLQASDCQRYLYYICEQDSGNGFSRQLDFKTQHVPTQPLVTPNFVAVLGFKQTSNSEARADYTL